MPEISFDYAEGLVAGRSLVATNATSTVGNGVKLKLVSGKPISETNSKLDRARFGISLFQKTVRAMATTATAAGGAPFSGIAQGATLLITEAILQWINAYETNTQVKALWTLKAQLQNQFKDQIAAWQWKQHAALQWRPTDLQANLSPAEKSPAFFSEIDHLDFLIFQQVDKILDYCLHQKLSKTHRHVARSSIAATAFVAAYEGLRAVYKKRHGIKGLERDAMAQELFRLSEFLNKPLEQTNDRPPPIPARPGAPPIPLRPKSVPVESANHRALRETVGKLIVVMAGPDYQKRLELSREQLATLMLSDSMRSVSG